MCPECNGSGRVNMDDGNLCLGWIACPDCAVAVRVATESAVSITLPDGPCKFGAVGSLIEYDGATGEMTVTTPDGLDCPVCDGAGKVRLAREHESMGEVPCARCSSKSAGVAGE